MPLQTVVNTGVAPGLPGMRASLESSAYAGNFLSEGAGVKVGGFVWAGTDKTLQVKGTGTGAPVGLVERNLSFPDFDLDSPGTLQVPPGWEVTVAVKGRYWVTATTAAVIGQVVFVVLADGSLKTAAAGTTTASGPFAGCVETAWAVKTAAAIGELFIIEQL